VDFSIKNFRTKTIGNSYESSDFKIWYSVRTITHTDQEKNFDSRFFLELPLLLGSLFFKKTRTTPFHPQSNGIVERQYQKITNYLAKSITLFQLFIIGIIVYNLMFNNWMTI